MSKPVLAFREFEKITAQSIFKNEDVKSEKLAEKIYKEIEDFAKESGIFLIRKGYIQPINYVGLIEINSAIVEILPKIYGEVSLKTSKKIFLNLLKILYNLPNYQFFENGRFKIENLSLLEIFIKMFLDEVEAIIKKGLKSDYILKEENLNFLKGRLLINRQISKNFVHKNRFYCEFDEYHLNRSENRIIKTTLKFLLNKSKNFENKRRIKSYLEHLYQVEFSRNIEFDFKNSKIDRHTNHYKNALIWARIFLKNKTFSPFSGDKEAFSILYPMDRLFESYVGFKLKQQFKKIDFQKSKLFIKNEENKPILYPRPDFIINEEIVADAKWKIINCDSDFSEKDFYQMFVYYHLFDAKELRLYYPKTKFLNSKKSFFYLEKIKLDIIPMDLSELKDSI